MHVTRRGFIARAGTRQKPALLHPQHWKLTARTTDAPESTSVNTQQGQSCQGTAKRLGERWFHRSGRESFRLSAEPALLNADGPSSSVFGDRR